MKKERIIWLDALRGLLIILVVLGHTLQHGDYENRLSWNIIYSFHMAAFFLVSGYVSYKKDVKVDSIIRRARQLLLPYIVWSVLAMIFIKGGDVSWLLTYIIKPDTSYWFIWVLFFISIIALMILSLPLSSKEKDAALLSGGVVLMGSVIVFNIKLFGFHFISYYFIFYAIGMLVGKYKIEFGTIVFILMGIIWAVMALFWKQHDIPTIVRWATFIPSSILVYVYRLISAIIGSLFFYELARRYLYKPKTVAKTLAYLGKISLGIYIIHLFFKELVGKAYLDLYASNTDMFFIVVDFIVKLSVGVLFTHFISKHKIPSLLLLGKV